MQIGQGESLVQFFVSGFANSPKSGHSSGEKRTGRFIANALFAEVAKKRFLDCSKGREKEKHSGRILLMVTPMLPLVCRNPIAAAIP